MANTKSNIKRIRSTKRKTEQNQAIRSRVKTAVKQARTALTAGDKEKLPAAIHAAVQQLDKAVEKKLIHKKNAARRKSRLMKHMNDVIAAE